MRHAEIHDLNGNTRGPAITNFVTLNVHTIITAVALTILSILTVITFVAHILVAAIILAIGVLAAIILTISVLAVITFLAILSLAVLAVTTFVAHVLVVSAGVIITVSIITVSGLDQGAADVVRNVGSADPTPHWVDWFGW
jgi:hypothetical protein